MLTHHEENIQTLRGLLGIDENEAAAKLATSVVITASDTPACRAFKNDLVAILGMTLQITSADKTCDIEVVVDAPPQTTAGIVLYVSLTDSVLLMSKTPLPKQSELFAVHGLLRKIAVCYAAGFVISKAVKYTLQHNDPYEVSFENLGISDAILHQNIVLTETALAGAGGIANGFMWALREIAVSGKMYIVDGKNVGSGNLNRCQYFDENDIGNGKAATLAQKAAISGLELIPVKETMRNFISLHGNARRVITTVDSRAARRAIQNDLPIEVIDASTTDISEIIVHSNIQPSNQPCLACIYPHVQVENQQEQHIADGLSLSLTEVQQGFIDKEMAKKLVENFPELESESLVGRAVSSLYKAKCAEESLKTTAGKQAAAPFAFISHLAGALLVVELLRFEADKMMLDRPNYLALNPWRMPHTRLRRTRAKIPHCQFCGQQDVIDTYKVVWPEYYGMQKELTQEVLGTV